MAEVKKKKMTRNDVIAKICDPSTKLEARDYEDLIRYYVDCTEGTGFMGKYLYGVNVRTPNDLKNVEPYFAASDNYASISPIEKDKRLPDFTDEFGIREMFFYADLDKESKPISIFLHTILSDAKTEIIDDAIKNKIIDWLKSEGSFFTSNVKNLKISSSRVYMWLSSEDFFTGASKDMQDYWVTSDNPNGKKNGQALSNILAISDDREFLQNQIISRRIELLNFLILLKARHLFEQNLQRLRASEKSAKAAIMSRNMSHNLGSHVMAYLKQHLYSVQDMVKDNILEQILSPEDTIESIQNDVDGWLKKIKDKIRNNGDNIQEIAMPFLVGLGKFISYLQERQDFIATIATDYSPYFSTVNFKDFIYDELNPDLRYERHRDRSGMRPDNILLGNIAKSEGLARVTRPTQSKKDSMSDIILKFKSFTGIIPPKPTDNENEDQISRKKRLENEKDLETMRKVEVSLPGGVVGRQAFFSIVENIIRNAAKHGKWGDEAGSFKRDLELTFDFFRDIKDFSKARVRDNYIQFSLTKKNTFRPDTSELDTKQFLMKYYSNATDISELSVFTITDNMWFELVPTKSTFEKYSSNSAVIEKLFQLSSGKNLKGIRNALLQRYIDKDGRMINENKGIKEMRISAAWMRSLNDSLQFNPFGPNSGDFFDEKGKWIGKSPILLARAVAQLNDHGQKEVVTTTVKVKDKDYQIEANPYNLQLLFCFMKPKKVAIISDRMVFADSYKEQLKDVSWAFFSSNEYCERSNKNRSYEFIVFDDCYQLDNQDKDLSKKKLNRDYLRIRCISHSRTYRLSSLPKKTQNKIFRVMRSKTIEKQTLETIEMAMYKTLADFKPQDFIRISDEKTSKKYNNNSEFDFSSMVSITDGIERDESDCLCKYIYRKHHENDLDFNLFMTEKPVIDLFASNDATDCKDKNIVSFVEGITGNNSTDRLVRNEPLTDKWAFAHLHAMKQKIAIFDERLFSKTYRIDEMDIVNHRGQYSVYSPIDRSGLASVLKQYNAVLPEEVQNATSEEELLKVVNAFLESRHNNSQKYVRADKTGLAFAMKGVYVFNIIKAYDHLDIYGFSGQDFDGSGYYSLVANLGRIYLDSNGNVRIGFNENCPYIGIFDRITIHQGLLDKIYETLGFKDDKVKKEETTKVIYDQLSVDRGEDIQQLYDDTNQKAGYFLPHLMIHSGRSKPSAADMPQHQPFIQYAAIEHAVLDCKYSLVELMDYARYEQYED